MFLSSKEKLLTKAIASSANYYIIGLFAILSSNIKRDVTCVNTKAKR